MDVYKLIAIGGASKVQLIDRLIAAGVQFNQYAKTLFEDPAFMPPQAVEPARLVKVKPSDLNLRNPYSIEQAIAAAARFALSPCPLYLAAFLRLNFLDQPPGSYLTVASRRLRSDEGYPSGLYLKNIDGTLWLRGFRAIGECDHPTDNEFVFMS